MIKAQIETQTLRFGSQKSEVRSRITDTLSSVFCLSVLRPLSICLLFSVFCLLFSVSASAEDVSFEVTVDKARVSLGESIELDLTFYGTQAVPTPYFPGVDGFSWRYMGPATLTSIINGRISSSIAHKYKLVPVRAGQLQIPSFSIQFRGQTYTSKPISIEVLRVAAGPSQRRQSYESRVQTRDMEEGILLFMEVDKKRAYINEIIPVTIKLYVERSLILKDIYYPQIPHKGFSIGEFAAPEQYHEVLEGLRHNVIEFNTNIFAVRAGKLTLGPAEVQCKLVIKEKAGRRFRSFLFDDDFFRRYATYPLKLASVDIPITIIPLPKENIPAAFSGALGNYKFSLEASPREVKVGDPITLRMTVSGEGNLKTVSPLGLDVNDDFKVYEPQISQAEASKTFEQVIIPKSDKVKEIPRINFSFFDPRTGEYKKITRGPIGIQVNPLPRGEELRIFEVTREGEGVFRRKEILGRDIIYIKDTPGKLGKKGALLCKNKLFVTLQFIPLLAVIAALVFQRRRERLQSDIGYARRLRAPGRAKKNLLIVRGLLSSQRPKEFFDAVFKTLQEYLGDKFHLPTAGITANIVGELRQRNIEQEVLNKVGECFNSCDIARYAPSSITKGQMLRSFNLLEEIIAELERMKR